MELITGITGQAAEPEAELRPEPQTTAPAETPADPGPVEPAKPEPTLEERSYTMVGRAMRFVMKALAPNAWQSVVQEMAGHMPARIELKPAPGITWKSQERHRQLTEELRDQGFEDAGMFHAISIETNLHLMVNQAYDVRAVLYEKEDSGIVLDLVTLFGDGTGITYVNRDDPGHEQSPLHPNKYLGDVPVFELLDTCLRDRSPKARLPETPAAAPLLTELEYQFGAKRLRGESVNPIEIADAYMEAIQNAAGNDCESEEAATAFADFEPLPEFGTLSEATVGPDDPTPPLANTPQELRDPEARPSTRSAGFGKNEHRPSSRPRFRSARSGRNS